MTGRSRAPSKKRNVASSILKLSVGLFLATTYPSVSNAESITGLHIREGLGRIFSKIFPKVTQEIKLDPPSQECPVDPNLAKASLDSELNSYSLTKPFSKNEIKAFLNPKEPSFADDSRDFHLKQLKIRNRAITFTYDQKGYAYGKAHNLIFENINPNTLPPGSFTYVITKDGDLIFGRVSDVLEYGAKHAMIAHGKSVVAAGELKVGEKGPEIFNIQSGSYTFNLISDGPHGKAKTTADRVKNIAEQVFKSFGKDLKYTTDPFLPEIEPSDETMRSLCFDLDFCSYNRKICGIYYMVQYCDSIKSKSAKRKSRW